LIKFNRNQIIIFSLFIILSFFTKASYASDTGCLTCYNKMVVAIENASNAAKDGNPCRAADHIEMALNWLGTCENECLYDRTRMQKLSSYKIDLMRALALYVKKCGH